MAFNSLMEMFGESLAERNGGWACYYCKTPLSRTHNSRAKDQATIDHILPRSRGGKTVIENLALACRFCNCSKNNNTVEEWNQRKLQIGLPTLYRAKDGSLALFNGDELVGREEAIKIVKSLMQFYNLLY